MTLSRETNRIVPEITGRSREIRDMAMWPAGSIQGTVRRLGGKPLEGVIIQAFGFDRRGECESSPLRTATTDSFREVQQQDRSGRGTERSVSRHVFLQLLFLQRTFSFKWLAMGVWNAERNRTQLGVLPF